MFFLEDPATQPKDGLRLDYVYIDQADIIKLINRLPSKTSNSPYEVPYVFIKNCKFTLLPALSHIYQFSLYSGTLPSAWKKAKVMPLLKYEPSNAISNYRPISLTSAFSKIIEKHVYDALYSYFVCNNILPNAQHGFRSGKSTTTQLLETFDEITCALEDNLSVDIAYFDFSKVQCLFTHLRYSAFSLTTLQT